MIKLKKISEILAVIPVLLALIIALISAITEWTFLIGSVNGNVLVAILFAFSAFLLLISTIAAIIAKDEKQTVIKTVCSFVTIIVFCFMFFSKNSDNKDFRYYEFTSPDGNYTVVAEEGTYLLSGQVHFYERKNPFFVVHKDLFLTDDGYRPISSGEYTVEWYESVMIFTANNGNNIYKTIKIGL